MGAIVATLYALGHDSHSLESIIRGVNFLSLIDIDMKRWVLKGKKIEKFLDTLFE
jgi:predicted acylesterase/phospholipase RssA